MTTIPSQNINTGQIATDAASSVFLDMYGNENTQFIKPLFLKNRTMTVACSSSTIAQDIRLNQAKIVEKINEILGTNEVDRIRYLS